MSRHSRLVPLRVCDRDSTDERQRLAAPCAELRQAGKVGDPIHLIRETRFLEQHEVGLGGANHRGDCAFASAPSVLDVVGE